MYSIKDDIKLIFSYFKKLKISKSKLIIIFVTMIISNCVQLVNPLFLGRMIDGIVNKSLDAIKLNLLFMVLFFVVSIIISYFNSTTLIKLTLSVERDITANVFSSILKAPHIEFNKKNKGTLLNNIEIDSKVISSLLSENISLIMDLISILISICLMIFVSFRLTIILFLIFPIVGIIYLLAGKKIKLQEIKLKKKHDFNTSFINETIYGWKFLKLFNAEHKRVDIFIEKIKELQSIEIKKFLIQVWAGISINLVTFIANILSIIAGIYLIFQGKLSLGMLTAFNNYSDTFKNSALSIAQFSSTIQETCVSLNRIEEILRYSETYKIEESDSIELKEKIQNIKIENLSFSNLEGVELFKDINFEFKSPNIYLIQGRSGAGKTTLFNILSKFINTYTGEISINNASLKNINVHSLRNRVSFITQESFLYSISIYDNITLYRNISLERIIEVCKRLNIHDAILSLNDGYNTIIGNNGVDLSGGERQRVCIARAIINEPDVYLFDEITSAIDKKNTLEILRILEEIAKEALVIIASHEDLQFSVPIIKCYLKDKKILASELCSN